jgi:hypothetical protein
VDSEVLAASENFGGMYLADVIRTDRTERLFLQRPGEPIHGQMPGRPINELWTGPCFHITQKGFSEFISFGRDRACEPAITLLERHGISSKQVTLVAHQASKTLLDSWEQKLDPAYSFNTMTYYANMTVASIPVNLALALSPWKEADRQGMGLKVVSTPYVLLLALGPDMHAHALLLGKLDASA